MANSYETTVQINGFSGFYQGSPDDRDTPMKYAVDGKNFGCKGGQLHSMDGGVVHADARVYDGTQTGAAFPAPIGTLMLLYRRFQTVDYPWALNDPAILVAAAGGHLYTRPLSAPADAFWIPVQGITTTNDRMDYVTYETSTYYCTVSGETQTRVSPNRKGETDVMEVVAEDPIDVLIMTNPEDGMIILYGDTLEAVPFSIIPDPTQPEKTKKFGVLTRHAERIWGAGIPGDPDMLMYSTPFEPFNWEANTEYPEDGAGDIQQPSWDGDSFVALRTYGSYLMGIKKNRIWRVSGTNPAEYYFKEQFGGGTLVENTVVTYNDYMYMLSYDGLMAYEGNAVQPFKQPYIEKIVSERLNWSHVDKAVAAMRGTTYCLAVPLDESEINNAVIEYDVQTGVFTLREGVYAASFLPYEDNLYYTDSRSDANDGGKGRVMVLNGKGYTLPMRYVSAWQDLGYKSVTKSGFEVYLLADQPITVTVGIRTEKKLKSRTVQLVADKPKKIRLNVSGRTFRLELDVPEPPQTSAPVHWTIGGGIQINMELDWD